MNKIPPLTAINSPMSPRETTPTLAQSAMSPLELTPLSPPGSAPGRVGIAAAASTLSEVPGWRHAVFNRAFDDIQQKLAERRHDSTDALSGTTGGLSVAERRDCDTALQWISACVVSARES